MLPLLCIRRSPRDMTGVRPAGDQGVATLPTRSTSATLRLSLPSPFQEMNNPSLSVARAGESGLVSSEISLPPKLAPLSEENMTLRLSLPSPFHARNKSPKAEPSAGEVGLVSPRMTLLENPSMPKPPEESAKRMPRPR